MFFPEQGRPEAEKHGWVEVLVPVNVRDDIKTALIAATSMVAEEEEIHCEK